MKRGGWIQRYTPLASGKARQLGKGKGGKLTRGPLTPSASAAGLRRKRWMKARNAERKAKEWARAYGSEPRVLWVQSLPCVGCGAMPSENAHTVSGGKSRKADAKTIAPLCGDDRNGCHRKYDDHAAPFDQEDRRDAVKLHAAFTDVQWTRMGETRRAS